MDNDVITLISKPFPDKPEIRTEVFAECKSVNRYEFYTASSQGIMPSVMFSIFKYDYTDETRIEYDGKLYNVVRAFEVKNERLELTCAGFELGQFNAKIKIVLPVRPKELFTPDTYTELAEIYAYRVQSAGSETEGVSAITETENIIFRFLSPADFILSTVHEIVYNEKHYNITSIVPILGREEYLEVITRSR